MPVPTPPQYATITRPGKLRVNGADVAGLVDGASNYGLDTTAEVSTPLVPWTFGSQYDVASHKHLQGHIAEIIIFAAVHTPAEISAMETYLIGKF